MDNVVHITSASFDHTNQPQGPVDIAALEAKYEALTAHDIATYEANPLKNPNVIGVEDIPGMVACSQASNARYEFIADMIHLRSDDPAFAAFKARVVMAEFKNDREFFDFTIEYEMERHPDDRDTRASLALSIVRDMLDRMGDVKLLTPTV